MNVLGGKFMKKESKKTQINIDKIKNAVIIVLSLIIVFGLAYVIPELKNCKACNVVKELTQISMDEYRELLNGEEVSLIYIASPTCPHCINQKPIMNRLVNEYDVVVNYLNTNNLSMDEADELYELYGDVQVERYGEKNSGVLTPTIILVQNGKLVDMNLGEIDLDDLVAFLSQYMNVEE